tara:strand:+ start:6659 stop:6982 length:324 start_codon:yes stop_codon:yes gene_type:complete
MGYKPNKAMQAAAQTALNYNENAVASQRWGTRVGTARARKLAAGLEFNRTEIAQIFAFLKRFEKDYKAQQASKKYGKGYYAFLGWGGPTGIAWAEEKLTAYENATNR